MTEDQHVEHEQPELASVLNRNNLNIAALASSESSRYAISGILITPTETVASDGHALIRVTVPTVPEETLPGLKAFNGAATSATWAPFIMAANQALEIAKAIPKKPVVLPVLRHAFVSGDAEQIGVTDMETERTFSVSRVKGEYPDYAKLIPPPEEAVVEMGFDAALLVRVLKQVASIVRQYNCAAPVRLRFYPEKQLMRIDASTEVGDAQEVTAVVMSYRV